MTAAEHAELGALLEDGAGAPPPGVLAAIVARRRARARRHAGALAATAVVVLGGTIGGLAATRGESPSTPPTTALVAARLELAAKQAALGAVPSAAPSAELGVRSATTLALRGVRLVLTPLATRDARLVTTPGGRACAVTAGLRISASRAATGQLVAAAPAGNGAISALAGTVLHGRDGALFALVAARVGGGVLSLDVALNAGSPSAATLEGRWAVAVVRLPGRFEKATLGPVTLVARDATGAIVGRVRTTVGSTPLVAASCATGAAATAGSAPEPGASGGS